MGFLFVTGSRKAEISDVRSGLLSLESHAGFSIRDEFEGILTTRERKFSVDRWVPWVAVEFDVPVFYIEGVSCRKGTMEFVDRTLDLPSVTLLIWDGCSVRTAWYLRKAASRNSNTLMYLYLLKSHIIMEIA